MSTAEAVGWLVGAAIVAGLALFAAGVFAWLLPLLLVGWFVNAPNRTGTRR
jgi:hypothetical protein